LNLTEFVHIIPGARAHHLEPCEIAGLTCDSRLVRPDYAFFAVTGTRDNGHRYIEDALRRGARAIIAEQEVELPRPVPQLIVQNARHALADVARAFYGAPSTQLTVTGITGTNGKTSTAYLTRAILGQAGRRAGMIGTILVDLGTVECPATHTTPECVDIQKFLAQMRLAGLSHAVMETSSHALDQGRLRGVDFHTAVFTNLTPEHLDYHKTMENYLECKAKLFDMVPPGGWAILNADDPASYVLARRAAGSKLFYGIEAAADVTADIQWADQTGTRIRLGTPHGAQNLLSPLIGLHNVYNVLAAAANALVLGVPLPEIAEAIEAFPGVPGRLQRVRAGSGNAPTVLVDYAHTADALYKVLSTLKPLRGGGRLITVFGCGGDRDRTKRPEMAKAAEALSDEVWITSDNPRTEDPHAIIQQILAGVRSMTKCRVEPDRRLAIDGALQSSRPGDIVAICGKGHEDYQIIGDRKYPFDDVQIAREGLERHFRSRGQ
jgi:UDP-N-acetylmuramoyl-L-alanyl-D-glutamate--2,6-diaminopimelate ligase